MQCRLFFADNFVPPMRCFWTLTAVCLGMLLGVAAADAQDAALARADRSAAAAETASDSVEAASAAGEDMISDSAENSSPDPSESAADSDEETDYLQLMPVDVSAESRQKDIGYLSEKTGVLRIDTINFEDYAHETRLDRILSRIGGAKVRNGGGALQTQTFSFRGAADQDIGVNYRGARVNSLSDAVADFSFFAPELLGTAHVYGTGAASSLGAPSGLVELTGNASETPVLGRFSLSTLADFSLFARGRHDFGGHRVALSSFGDWSKGEFRYTDAQGSSQIRRHNAAARVGGEIVYDGDFGDFKLSAFSFFSQIDRQEAGASEYPDAYRRALGGQFLSLGRVSAETLPTAMGKSYATFAASISQRVARKTYENPTTLIGYRSIRTRHFENQTDASLKGEWEAGGISSTQVALRYSYQRAETFNASGMQSLAETHDRHIASVSAGETLRFMGDDLIVNASGGADRQVGTRWLGAGALSAAYKTPIGIELGVSSAYAQRLPSFDELYYRTEFIRGNPDLKPQKSIVNELTAAWRCGGIAEIKLSGFYNFHRDLIRYVPESPTLTRVKNYADAVARGLELSADWQFFDGAFVRVGYAWTNAQTAHKTPLPQVPSHRVSGELSYRKKPFGFSFSAQYESPSAQNMSATSWSAPRVDLGIEASLELVGGISIGIAVYNLLDDRRRQDVLQRPLPGRHGAVSVRIAPN